MANYKYCIFYNQLIMIFENDIHLHMYEYFEINNIQIYFSFYC